MIISVSRRTDIPAFFSDWFMERVRAGYCHVPNPMRPTQVSQISLLPENVDCLVFWSKSPVPLYSHLPELDSRGFNYYFQFTLNGYPRSLEPYLPETTELIAHFARLAQAIGLAKVVWRYDPIIISGVTPYDYHLQRFAYLAQALRGHTKRVVISLFDWYPFLRGRLQKAPYDALQIAQQLEQDEQFGHTMRGLAQVAQDNGMQIQSCAEAVDLEPYGIKPGSCIDGDLIKSLFGIQVTKAKDHGQRVHCDCVQSRDIGVYSTCGFQCVYCYARRTVHVEPKNIAFLTTKVEPT